VNFAFLSESHLGDCLLHAHFMRKVVEHNPNITFDFYLIKKHWDQTLEYISDIPQIRCLQYDLCPQKHLRGWVGQFGIPSLPCQLDNLRLNSYKKLSHLMGIECPFRDVYDLLYDNPNINKHALNLPQFDVLLINSIPLSNQIKYNANDYENLAHSIINKQRTVITTAKIPNIPCTLDLELTVMGIGSLSLNCNIIAGIGTGAMQCCLNAWTKNKKIYYIDNHHTFQMKHITMINNITVLIP